MSGTIAMSWRTKTVNVALLWRASNSARFCKTLATTAVELNAAIAPIMIEVFPFTWNKREIAQPNIPVPSTCPNPRKIPRPKSCFSFCPSISSPRVKRRSATPISAISRITSSPKEIQLSMPGPTSVPAMRYATTALSPAFSATIPMSAAAPNRIEISPTMVQNSIFTSYSQFLTSLIMDTGYDTWHRTWHGVGSKTGYDTRHRTRLQVK